MGHLYAGRPGTAIVRYLTLSVGAGGAALLLFLTFPFGPATVPITVLLILGLYAWTAFDAQRAAAAAPADYQLRPYNRWYVYIAIWVGVALVQDPALAPLRARLRAYHIPSGAMEPTLLPGDMVFVLHTTSARAKAGPGEIVVLESKEEPALQIIKRIVGLPGDTLRMAGNTLYRNGVAVREPYAMANTTTQDREEQDEFAWQAAYVVGDRATYRPTTRTWGPLLVPTDSIFLLGDNRDESYDSRYFGFVGKDRVRGRPLRIYYSYDAASPGLLSWLTAVRWDRMGLKVE